MCFGAKLRAGRPSLVSNSALIVDGKSWRVTREQTMPMQTIESNDNDNEVGTRDRVEFW